MLAMHQRSLPRGFLPRLLRRKGVDESALHNTLSPLAHVNAPSPALHNVVPHEPPAASHPLSSRIPRRLLFCYGLFDAQFRLRGVGDCDFSLPGPPLCVSLADQADLLPPRVAASLRTWSERYPANAGWEHVIVDGVAVARLAAAHFPDLVTLLDSLTGVQRADVARLMLLSAWGGFYADVDTAPGPRVLDDLLREHPSAGALFFEEAVLSQAAAEAVARAHPIRAGVPEARQRISNYVMASAPTALVPPAGEASTPKPLSGACTEGAVRAVLDEVVSRLRAHPALSPADADYEVLFTTGPDAVTSAVHTLRGWSLAGDDIMGLLRLDPASDIETVARNVSTDDDALGAKCATVIPRPIDQRYFSHGAAGSWKGRG